VWYLFITSPSGNTVYACQAYETEEEAQWARGLTVGYCRLVTGSPRQPLPRKVPTPG